MYSKITSWLLAAITSAVGKSASNRGVINCHQQTKRVLVLQFRYCNRHIISKPINYVFVSLFCCHFFVSCFVFWISFKLILFCRSQCQPSETASGTPIRGQGVIDILRLKAPLGVGGHLLCKINIKR